MKAKWEAHRRLFDDPENPLHVSFSLIAQKTEGVWPFDYVKGFMDDCVARKATIVILGGTIDPESAVYVADALKRMPNLRSMEFEWTGNADVLSVGIAEMMLGGASELYQVIFDDCGAGDAQIKILTDAFEFSARKGLKPDERQAEGHGARRDYTLNFLNEKLITVRGVKMLQNLEQLFAKVLVYKDGYQYYDRSIKPLTNRDIDPETLTPEDVLNIYEDGITKYKESMDVAYVLKADMPSKYEWEWPDRYVERVLYDCLVSMKMIHPSKNIALRPAPTSISIYGKISPRAASGLARVLLTIDGLKRVNLNNTGFANTEILVGALVKQIRDHKLYQVKLNNCGVTDGQAGKLIDAFKDYIETNEDLSYVIDIGDDKWKLTKEGFKKLFDTYKDYLQRKNVSFQITPLRDVEDD